MRQVKTVYCIVAISLAVILASVGGLLGVITAIIVLAGALPLFRAVGKAMKAATLHDVEQQAKLIADQTEPSQQLKQHQDQRPQST